MRRFFGRSAVRINPATGLPQPPLLVRAVEQLSRLPRRRALIWALSLSASIAWADHVTGYSMGLSRFHLATVALVSWTLGRGPGLAMAALTLSAWTVGERMSAPDTASHMPAWHAFVRSIFAVAGVFVLSALRQAMDVEKTAARTDFLTGAANRRHFVEIASAEIRRAKRYRRPFIVAYLDIDGFKAINDRFGHNQGDALLRLAAQTIRKGLREVDLVARMGGDEFAVLLPETGGANAAEIMRKMQARLAQAMEEMKWPVTFSIGTVSYASPPVSVDEMIKTADNLMYGVKKNGKNQIGFAIGGAPVPQRR